MYKLLMHAPDGVSEIKQWPLLEQAIMIANIFNRHLNYPMEVVDEDGRCHYIIN